VAWAAFLFRSRIRNAYRDIRVRLARINAYLHERITGMRVVQLFNREEADARRHAEINQGYLEAHLRSITYYALFFPVIEVFTAIALALIIWAGGVRMLEGTVTVGVLAAFLQFARRFFRPIQDLSEKYNLLQGAMASSERVFKLLDEDVVIRDLPDPLPLPARARGEIEFRDVWFAYTENAEGEPDWVLRGVSFRVAPGEKVAIVGHTGAGKTTLISLLLRFYEAQKGEILLDGIPIERLRLDELRSRIALVLQDVFLFSQDVGYNIGLGSPAIDRASVEKAAERVGARRFIERLPRGYQQPLGERGASLSVGERQLVSFARALAFDPSILILDEATSSVDSELEARIEEATTEVMAGRTSLVIAHGSPPCNAPTGSWCSTAGRCGRRARTRSCSSGTGSMRDCTSCSSPRRHEGTSAWPSRSTGVGRGSAIPRWWLEASGSDAPEPVARQNLTRTPNVTVVGAGTLSELPNPSSLAPPSGRTSTSHHGTSRCQVQAFARLTVRVASSTDSGNAKPTGIVAYTLRSLK
jgi:ABC-type bacteriocin/lantibiotic exporter with double-glycine peptidase domain